jgi:hypothetical protein
MRFDFNGEDHLSVCVGVCASVVNDTRCFGYFVGYVNRKKDGECFLLGRVMEWCKMMEGGEPAKRCVHVYRCLGDGPGDPRNSSRVGKS